TRRDFIVLDALSSAAAFGELERFAFLRARGSAAANALDTNAQALNFAADLDLQTLQIGFEDPLADAGNLTADAAEVFGLAAPGDLIANFWFLAADGA